MQELNQFDIVKAAFGEGNTMDGSQQVRDGGCAHM